MPSVSTVSLVLLDAVWVVGSSVAVGASAPRWPHSWLDTDRFPVCRWPGESIARYRPVAAFAGRLPEGGRWFGGQSKAHLPGTSTADLRDHLVEVRRAEWVHWWSVALALPLFLANPPMLAAAFVVAVILVNAPFILVLRRNRLRLTRAALRRVDR